MINARTDHGRLVRDELLDEASTPPPRDPFELDAARHVRLVRDAVTVQSRRAIDMAREAGLETPKCN